MCVCAIGDWRMFIVDPGVYGVLGINQIVSGICRTLHAGYTLLHGDPSHARCSQYE